MAYVPGAGIDPSQQTRAWAEIEDPEQPESLDDNSVDEAERELTPVGEDASPEPASADPASQAADQKVNDLLRDGKLKEALDCALNSEGDSISLSVAANGSVAVTGAAVNVGASGGVSLEVTKTADGYELVAKGELKGTAGVELYQGTEANLLAGPGVSAKFKFDSPEELARGTAALAAASTGAAGMAVDAGANLVDAGAHKAAGWAKHIPIVGGAASRALDTVGDAAHAVDEVTGPDALKFLKDHMSGVVLSGSAAAKVEATLTATPGAKTQNVPELAAGAGLNMEASYELQFHPPKLIVQSSGSLEMNAQGSVAPVGGELSGSAKFTVTSTYAIEGSGNPLDLLKGEAPLSLDYEGSSAGLELEGKAEVSGGAGISAGAGAGGKVSMEVDPWDLVRTANTDNLSALARGDARPLLKDLGDTPIKLTSSTYSTQSLKGSLALSELGTGGGIEFGLERKDYSQPSEITTTPDQLLPVLLRALPSTTPVAYALRC